MKNIILFRSLIHIEIAASLLIAFTSCKKNHPPDEPTTNTIRIENVLDGRPLVESGTFRGEGSTPEIKPGKSFTIHFSAAKGEALSFATMYGWSNDMFFAPANPGIQVYTESGTPIQGDVSAQIKLWDNGTRINQKPGSGISHPGVAESTPKNIKEVAGADDQGNVILPSPKLMEANLVYDGNSYFTLTIKNISGGTANETPFSPGVWSVSYIAGGKLLSPSPLYTEGKPSANGLTSIAEAGDNGPLANYIMAQTGIFTPLSPVLVVVFTGNQNPFYAEGEKDRGEGLKELAQQGNADILAAALKMKSNVKMVYVLKEAMTTVLLPKMTEARGGQVSQQLSVVKGDRIAIATMYGFSNDWFFATAGNGVDALTKGDISSKIVLYDNGTALNQFPGAGITQFNLAGTPLAESKAIQAVPNPNGFTTLPDISKMINVTIQ